MTLKERLKKGGENNDRSPSVRPSVGLSVSRSAVAAVQWLSLPAVPPPSSSPSPPLDKAETNDPTRRTKTRQSAGNFSPGGLRKSERAEFKRENGRDMF